MRANDYASMDIHSLMEASRKKHIPIPASLRSIRGVTNDREMDADRLSLINQLGSIDARRRSITSNRIASISLIVAIVALLVSLFR